MVNQRKPHERDVLLMAIERTFVGYFGTGGQIGTGIPVHERPAEPPVGTVYEQKYILYQDIELEDGTVLQLQCLSSEKTAPREFLRGKHAPAGEFYQQLPEVAQMILDDMVIQGALSGTQVEELVGILVKGTSGDYVAAFSLMPGDVPPPVGASEYAVGESPEEQRMAEMGEEAIADDEADELAEIRQAVKDGVYDEEEEAAVGGGHPVIQFSGSDDDDPRAA